MTPSAQQSRNIIPCLIEYFIQATPNIKKNTHQLRSVDKMMAARFGMFFIRV